MINYTYKHLTLFLESIIHFFFEYTNISFIICSIVVLTSFLYPLYNI
uniref:Uncharacterized protein n=1 Tax=virus sp. ctE0n6 TaxID=2827985 RepID=A0A8S5RF42_9VIRU|nr:MAG TPA: hypothetical protein [virus sp. ctE0n6]